jgi:thiosulfate sulfurtransferase
MDAVKEIWAEEARSLLDTGKAFFVDIRDQASFQKGHIPGALLLNEANTEDFVTQTDKTKTLVVYCYHGNESKSGAAFLMDQGFNKVYSLTGGFNLWKKTEKPNRNPLEILMGQRFRTRASRFYVRERGERLKYPS